MTRQNILWECEKASKIRAFKKLQHNSNSHFPPIFTRKIFYESQRVPRTTLKRQYENRAKTGVQMTKYFMRVTTKWDVLRQKSEYWWIFGVDMVYGTILSHSHFYGNRDKIKNERRKIKYESDKIKNECRKIKYENRKIFYENRPRYLIYRN